MAVDEAQAQTFDVVLFAIAACGLLLFTKRASLVSLRAVVVSDGA